MTVVFYISGHGFGHASRDIEVINALLARRQDLRVVVRTTAARWLFERTVRTGVAAFAADLQARLKPGPTTPPSGVEYNGTEVDTGVVQIDSLHLDAAESVRRARDFMATFGERVAREASVLRRIGASLVVADLPPLGIAAAARAGIPAIALGNFTWEWIYADYPDSDDVVQQIAEAYRSATLALRLPMHGGFAAFDTVVDVPFVARRATREPQDTRRAFGLPLDERLVLVSFGGYGLERLDLEALTRLDGYVALVSDSVPLPDRPPGLQGARRGSLLPLDETRIYDNGYRYEDLVRAVDVVVTKPGYGIIAECLANDTALLYTSRGHFIEYEVLVAAMPRFLRTAFIDHPDLLAGRWQSHLDRLLAQPDPPERPATNGAEIAADHLVVRL